MSTAPRAVAWMIWAASSSSTRSQPPAADPALTELLGREPAGLRDVLHDALRERTSAG
ncbi:MULTISPECIES: hypothetical protein [Streptomyces]|uniref:hypothetical protein n=1 Tax=Streptomyces TaxID=1883 RepID=UPI001CC9DC08|nr:MULTISPECIES: hypothetical protein [Streptomyces]MBZ6133844.1 hypothetical protein [Streptomyces olivaceus]MBZ6173332.1 hypothetical protein [Streptomyces olivaceus]MBZ6179753.1 hypothetical protein [Streptomyces olivaceus]MCM8553497.1 hypothetical protein [Streptomyces sp. STCH 565 A]